MSDIASEKKELRRVARRGRAAAHMQYGHEAGRMLAKFGLGFAGLADNHEVSGYIAIRDEIDPAPLLEAMSDKGHALALPVIIAPDQALFLAGWTPGDDMAKGPMDIPEPVRNAASVSVDVDCMLVPLLAVDRRGYRLGYGGGFYDRTIAALSKLKAIKTVGLAFDEQIVDAVPHDDYDQRLDWILTPSGPIECQDN
ncbi:MAG: 5-formyltetrahydrofolate cyclo-ligase [Pseudomonadota bacterium]